MTTTSSGAVGFAPVGTFVKDLASELGKAPATLVAYLKKHLPATLTKRKNANKRLANFVTEDGVAGLRAHYTPTTESSELQRLREENARLRERVRELESALEDKQKAVPMSEVNFSFSRTKKPLSEMSLQELVKENERIQTIVSEIYGLPTTRRQQRRPRTFASNDKRVIPFGKRSDDSCD